MRLQIEIRESLHEKLTLVARTRGISVSAYVREAIEDKLDPQPWAKDIADVQLFEVSAVEDTQANRDAGAGRVLPSGVQRGVAGLKKPRGT